MAKKPSLTEQRVVLPNVSWQQYETLLAELGPERTTRLTYFRGKLELMTPIEAHERCNKLIESLILVLVDELQITLTVCMPIILKHIDLGYATEPDACYYFQYQSPIHHYSEIDLSQEPPPDLVMEVALTKSPIDKLPIYAAMGIPEVWRYATTAGDEVLKGNLSIYQLQDHQYRECSYSLAFPLLSAQRVLEFLEQSDAMSLATALRLLRSWIQERL